jgi:hypothetical protein
VVSHPRTPSQGALPVVFLICALFSSGLALQAKDPPSDLCTVLPGTQLEKVLQETYDPPAKSTAPAAFPGGASGTECDYKNDSYRTGKGLPRKMVFIVYVDASPAVAKDTFNKLNAFFGPSTPVPGIGDAAYRDSGYAVHVVKGKVRYYINMIPIETYTSEKEKQLMDLVVWVAGQL